MAEKEQPEAFRESEQIAARAESAVSAAGLTARARRGAQDPGAIRAPGSAQDAATSPYRPAPQIYRCEQCQRDEAEATRVAGEAANILAAMPGLSDRALRRSGVSTRERSASLDLVPANIRRLFGAPALGVEALMAGEEVRRGFGLSGGAGCGKTFALVALFKAAVEARLRTRAPKIGRAALLTWLAWTSWPTEVNDLRVMSTQEEGLVEARARILRLSKIEALVIDDLGVERLRGTYEDDWAASQLDALVDARYNEMLPTWYTTNLTADELQDRYGSRLYSRLCAENPLRAVPGPDLRLVGRSTAAPEAP